MKTTGHARQVLRLRVWAGTLGVVLLVSAELWMVCRVGQGYGHVTTRPVVQVPAVADWLAAR